MTSMVILSVFCTELITVSNFQVDVMCAINFLSSLDAFVHSRCYLEMNHCASIKNKVVYYEQYFVRCVISHPLAEPLKTRTKEKTGERTKELKRILVK